METPLMNETKLHDLAYDDRGTAWYCVLMEIEFQLRDQNSQMALRLFRDALAKVEGDYFSEDS